MTFIKCSGVLRNNNKTKYLQFVAAEEAETTLFIALYDQTRQHFLQGCAKGVFLVSTDLKEKGLHDVY